MSRLLLLLALLLAAPPGAGQTSDQAIQSRAENIISAVAGEDAEAVEVTVIEGVVGLQGTITSDQDAARIEQILTSLEGVVAVNNDLELDLAVGARIDPVKSRLSQLARKALAIAPLLGVAVVLLIVFWILSRFVGRAHFLLRHVVSSPPLRELILKTLSALVFIIGMVLALDILGATAMVGGVLGAAGVMGIAIGFAFRDLIENYIASIMLSIRQPFSPNDHVVIDDHEGIVARLTTRTTVLITLEGNSLRIPNSQVFKGVILNYSNTPERRFSFTVGIGYDVDLELAQSTGIETLMGIEGVLDSPGPVSRVTELGDSTVSVCFLAWVDTHKNDFSRVRSRALARIKQVFDDNDIDMPEPIYNLRISRGKPAKKPRATTPARVVDATILETSEASQQEFVERKAQQEREETGRNLIEDGEHVTD